ncbi:MAG: saccharopine dehydrogenase NADP-binding domain-containing protein [Myxococcales bacterium]|nr:saccharopine dehydrogenase NADP-binding domain-containing protein [Myxococcales bacterium]
MTEATHQRAFDLVLFGATGFTGRLVAEYLAERCREGLSLRWAMAGRDRAKLQAVQSSINTDVPILVGDAMDEGSMRLLAEQTRLVLTTVGPYAKYGSALVAACAAQGTDYCDLTGEVHWMRAMIDAHHETARRTGARIVHTCGYDSIPSDLGTLALFDHVERTHGKKLERITHYAGESRGGISGGTIASMLALMEISSRDRSLRKLLANPYALNPEPLPEGPDGPDPMGVRYDDGLGMWTGPFVMAAVNSRVVRRSNALLDFRYGKQFRYTELSSTGRGTTGLARASALTAGLGSFMVLLQNTRARSLLAKRVLPKPGEGPSRATIEQGFFTSRFVGHGDGITAKLTIRGKRDPGYGATARMISESALCLLQDDLPKQGGVLTPASAMGMALVPRLEKAGIRFEYE